MLIGGEKYACEACVRGHRVSNCQHADRPLTHINKKGRPVSQCGHCRALRKSRSAHGKCDCGEKVHNKATCPHMKDVESKGELSSAVQATSMMGSDITAADQCCCSHGGRCSCSLKKEHLDPVPESDSDDGSLPTPPSEIRRPRAHTTLSDGPGLTVFTNGHHKPPHRHNQMAHKCGIPYVVPRAHSIHGPSPSGLANRSVDNLPHTSTVDALHSESHIKDSIVSAQLEQRMVKSEHNSPIIGSASNLDLLNGQLPPLDLSNLDEFSNDFNYPISYDTFASYNEVETPIFSAALSSASIDWSHYDGLEFNNDSFATSTFSQAPSYNGFEFSSIDQPALTTTSTSGEISEVEDFTQYSDVPHVTTSLTTTGQYGSDLDPSDLGDHDKYRLSTTSSYVGLPQAQVIGGNDVSALDIDEFIKGVAYRGNSASADGLPISPSYVEDKFIPTSASGPYDNSSFQLTPTEEDEALWMSFTAANPLNNVNSEGHDLNVWTQ